MCRKTHSGSDLSLKEKGREKKGIVKFPRLEKKDSINIAAWTVVPVETASQGRVFGKGKYIISVKG